MPLFEVFIPSNDPDGFNITARLQADSWIQALRSGLAKLGDTADVHNIMVDIKETGIEVTEPQSGRVFRIRELDREAAPAAAAPPVQAPAVQAAPPPAAAPRAAAPPPAAPPRAATMGAPPPARAAAPPPAATPRPATAAPPPAAAPPISAPPAAASGRVGLPQPPAAERFAGDDVFDLDLARQKTSEAPKSLAIGRGKVTSTRTVEDILGDLFVEVQDIYDQGDVKAAARFLLDLAVRSVPAESGAVFIADINASELTFAAALGPKADEVMKFRVPMGVGIVGFCAQEGVSLAVSDVEKDPHFYAAISQKIGYATRSILCSPAKQEGRVYGAIELINKKGDATFTHDEVNVLNYLAHEFSEFLVNTGQTGA